ncbi:hypothetical protein Ahy_B02g057872 isoform B [Arachis hypogaea]|uniref:RRM domain-containing protein n=1 Tax=Arachis hypogaea TaxID=3818 RepID=A0A445ADF4_ARAHY|nr:hypothetical protein Ahy_B02g057872 isoform A [Arachis hypogaea]RYR24372.1 hypothetical protein Ahy_B02g057872 isoform B [Arachis hypogaea]
MVMEATTLLDPQNSVTAAPLPTAAAGAANASKQLVTVSLYIGDLDPEVDENFYDLFDQVGQVVSHFEGNSLRSSEITTFDAIFNFSGTKSQLSWRVYSDAPDGHEPLALDMGSMGKVRLLIGVTSRKRHIARCVNKHFR